MKYFLNPLTPAEASAILAQLKITYTTEEDFLKAQAELLDKARRIPANKQPDNPSTLTLFSLLINLNFAILNSDTETAAFLNAFDTATLAPEVTLSTLNYTQRYWKFNQRHPYLIALSIIIISTSLFLGGFFSFGALHLLLAPFLSITAGVFLTLGLTAAVNLTFTGSVGLIIQKISHRMLNQFAHEPEAKNTFVTTERLKILLHALDTRVVDQAPKATKEQAHLTKDERAQATHFITKFSTFKQPLPHTTPLIEAKSLNLMNKS